MHVSSSPLDARASASASVSPHIRPSISPQSGSGYGGAVYHGANSGMPRGDLPRGGGGGGEREREREKFIDNRVKTAWKLPHATAAGPTPPGDLARGVGLKKMLS